MDMSHLATSRERLKTLISLCLTVVTASATAGVSAQAPSPANRAREVVAEVRSAGKAKVDRQPESAMAQLTALGEAAIPAIREGLEQERGAGSSAGLWLVMALAGIPGDGSTRLLLEVACASRGENMAALSCLTRRPIQVPLTDEEEEFLLRWLREQEFGCTGSVAQVLANCREVPAAQKIPPMIARFVPETRSPLADPPGRHHAAYIPIQVASLNAFILTFSAVGEPAIPFLREARDRAATAEAQKWLTLALGVAGDPEVSEETKRIIQTDENRYVRWVAIRAYGRSAGPQGIPFLQTLVNDMTESEYGSERADPDGKVHRVYLIQNAARSMIRKLEKQR